jgi:hypothetical protein
MKMRTCSEAWALGVSAAVLLGLPLACKDDDPCDPGQEERSANACYPAAGSAGTPGSAGQPGAGDAGAEDAAGGGAADFEIGQPCLDTTASGDCGGVAPICAPLPAGAACTQVLCLDGEANAGVCPPDWPCLQIEGYPSTCLKF